MIYAERSRWRGLTASVSIWGLGQPTLPHPQFPCRRDLRITTGVFPATIYATQSIFRSKSTEHTISCSITSTPLKNLSRI
jgi:hypothetical protein